MVEAVMPEESSPQAYRRGHKRLYCKIESEALASDNYTTHFKPIIQKQIQNRGSLQKEIQNNPCYASQKT